MRKRICLCICGMLLLLGLSACSETGESGLDAAAQEETQAEEALLRLIFIDMLRANLSFPLLDEYLNANLKTASLEDFARYSGYSVSHASRLVKARTGKSFSQLLDEARIDRACALLLSGRTALFAAAETGFATPAGFHRCFLRVKGITPAGYARSVKR